jgi:hypothetical protein
MIFLHKLIIGNKFLTLLKFLVVVDRLISHSGFHFDDYHVWKEFWYSINKGFLDTELQDGNLRSSGVKTQNLKQLLLSPEDYDALVERINEPPDPEALESIRKLLDRRAPWDT